MDIKGQAVAATAFLHLQDAAEEPLYATKPGTDETDLDKPVRVSVYGPGSKQYAQANARRYNRYVERMRKGKKIELSADEQRRETAEFLADTTHSFENMTYNGKPVATREDMIALYSDIEIGYIAEQVAKFGAEWGNFKKKPSTS
jgi:hypothetical protein